jgi:hypothetical protein
VLLHDPTPLLLASLSIPHIACAGSGDRRSPVMFLLLASIFLQPFVLVGSYHLELCRSVDPASIIIYDFADFLFYVYLLSHIMYIQVALPPSELIS